MAVPLQVLFNVFVYLYHLRRLQNAAICFRNLLFVRRLFHKNLWDITGFQLTWQELLDLRTSPFLISNMKYSYHYRLMSHLIFDDWVRTCCRLSWALCIQLLVFKCFGAFLYQNIPPNVVTYQTTKINRIKDIALFVYSE